MRFLKDLYRRIRLKLQLRSLERAEKRFSKEDSGNWARKYDDVWQELAETDFKAGEFVELNADYSLKSRRMVSGTELRRDGSVEVITLSGDSYIIPKGTRTIKEGDTFQMMLDYPLRDYAISTFNVKIPKKLSLEKKSK